MLKSYYIDNYLLLFIQKSKSLLSTKSYKIYSLSIDCYFFMNNSHQPKLFCYNLQVTVSLDSEEVMIHTTVNLIKNYPVFYKISKNNIKFQLL